MSSSKKTKHRGRPPKYVLDDEGKEIVGLSYNESNNMYYATGTNPRHYFNIPFQKNKKLEAIRQFYEWKKSTVHTAEDVEEQKKRNEIYQKAVNLIEDGHFKEIVEKKARELIDNDPIVNKALFKRARELLKKEGNIKFAVQYKMDDFGDGTNVYANIARIAKSYVKEWINNGHLDKEVRERVCDLMKEKPCEILKNPTTKEIVFNMIKKSPIESAKLLGIKEIAYVGVKYDIPLSWNLVWGIFNSHRDENALLYDKKKYGVVFSKMSMILGDPLLSNIKYAELYEALNLDPPIRPKPTKYS